MKRRHTSLRLLAALAVAAWPAATAAQAAPPVAEVETTADAIRFRPVDKFARLDLTVAGESLDWRKSFSADQAPLFEVGERYRQRTRVPDGRYTWELRAVPRVSDEVREKLEAAREASDRGLEVDLEELGLRAGALVQDGSFTVLDGKIVSPQKKEESPERQPREPGQKVEGDLEVSGDLAVRGAKRFAIPDPDDAESAIHFAALEGPEVGTYYRGSGRTTDGEAVIELPAYFVKVTEPQGITVQLTPLGGWSRLYVAEKSANRLVVRAADGADVEFDFLIQGVRRGYTDFDVERPSGPSR